MIPVQVLRQSPGSPRLPPDPDLLFTGDDWEIDVEVPDVATGEPFDMTGCTPGATLFLPDGSTLALTQANGRLTAFMPVVGAFKLSVERAVTATIPAMWAAGGRHAVTIQVFYFDTFGRLKTVETYAPLVRDPGAAPTSGRDAKRVRLAVYRQGPGGAPALITTHSFVFAAQADLALAHNLGRFPSVTIIDTAGDQVLGDVAYVDANNIRVSFSVATSGTVYLN